MNLPSAKIVRCQEYCSVIRCSSSYNRSMRRIYHMAHTRPLHLMNVPFIYTNPQRELEAAECASPHSMSVGSNRKKITRLKPFITLATGHRKLTVIYVL